MGRGEWTILLLDTCAAIWMADGSLRPKASAAVEDAASRGELFFSPVSAWEIGMLFRDGALKTPDSPQAWLERLLAHPGVQLASMTPAIAIQSSFLPGEFHRDPADRMLVATARELGLTLVTRDEKLLAYGKAGHVRVMAC